MRGDPVEIHIVGRVQVGPVDHGLQAVTEFDVIFLRGGPAGAIAPGNLTGGFFGRAAFYHVVGKLGGSGIEMQHIGRIDDQDAAAIRLEPQVQPAGGLAGSGLEVMGFGSERMDVVELVLDEFSQGRHGTSLLSAATGAGTGTTGAGTGAMAAAGGVASAAAGGDGGRVGPAGNTGGEGLHVTQHLAGKALHSGDH